MKRGLLVVLAFVLTGCQTDEPALDLQKRAQRLAQELIIVDTHVDVPYRLRKKMEDVSQSTETGNFDYPRAKTGGLNAPFMSIFIPSRYQKTGGAKIFADSLIDMVEKIAADSPDKFAIAASVSDVTSQFKNGLISLPMGMENGAPVEGDLQNLQHFYDRGIRYITLTHGKSNHICDSSYDPNKKWNGLSPFGEKVVAEMNRLGIMIDISHVSDSTFYQAAKLTRAPLIASHSSCRHFTPGWERNMSDDMIKRLAETGGVIQINFGSDFLSGEYKEKMKIARDYLTENNITDHHERELYQANFKKDNHVKESDVADVVAHIDRVVKLVGIDHVGIGSDYDGVGDSLPTGLKDVSGYPNLIEALLKGDYTEADIKKICSGNILRVWGEVEEIAKRSQEM